MKRILIMGMLLFAFLACRNNEEKQINLGDYDQSDTTGADLMPPGPEIPADSVAKDSLKTDSTETKKDSIKAKSTSSAQSDGKKQQ